MAKVFCAIDRQTINYIFSVVPLLFRSMYSPIQETWIGRTSRKWELLNWSSVHETWWNFIISLGTLSYYNRRNISWNQTISFSPDTILEFLCEHLITRIQTITGLRSKIEKVPRDIQVTGTWSCWNWKWLKIRPIAYLSMGNVPTYFEDKRWKI